MFDMSKIMEKMKEVQSKVAEAQEDLTSIKVEAEAGAGMVKATINGKKQLINLEIDSSLVNKDDAQTMKDLIIAAVNKGLEEADAKAKEALKSSTQGIIPDIPGMNLTGMI